MTYPMGKFPIPTVSGLLARHCVHCHGTVGIGRWDDLNGFLVRCPHCALVTGKSWSLNRPLVAGFLFNAISFFFVFRPAKALALFGLFAAWTVGVGSTAFGRSGPEWLQIAWGVVFFLGPVIVNAIELVRHESHLSRASR